MGQVLRKLVCLKEGWAIRNCLTERKEEAMDLLRLYHREWCDRINAPAFQTLKERKYNIKELLPLTEDLQKLKKYQVEQMINCTNAIKTKPTGDLWRKLALTTLGRISIFNKRREAEIGEIPLSLYLQSRTATTGNGDIMEGLTDFERGLCSRLHHFEIIGKQGRKVPVVLTKDMVEALDTLINNRTYAKALPNNPYLFANGGKSHLKTAEAIKLATREAGLSRPDLITSTKLRKYMATVSQVVSLTENELEYLANHMGHNIKVHRDFYRLQESTIELAKVSRLLLAAERGSLGSFTGKKLDDIIFSDLPEYSEEVSRDLPEPVDVEPQATSGEVCVPPKSSSSDMPGLGQPPSSSLPGLEESSSSNMPAPPDVVTDLLDDGDIRALVDAGNRHSQKSQKVKPTKRTCWTCPEMEAVAGLVEQSVVERKPPTKTLVSACLAEKPVLRGREWKAIKFRVWAEAQKVLKKRDKVKSNLLAE